MKQIGLQCAHMTKIITKIHIQIQHIDGVLKIQYYGILMDRWMVVLERTAQKTLVFCLVRK